MVKVRRGDGSSFETAIIISECNNTEGVEQEYREIKDRFGPYKLTQQSLIKHENKMYDLLELEINGEEVKVYFDITAFFGKGLFDE